MEYGIIFSEDQRADLKSQFPTSVFAPEDRLKLRPDIIVTGMTTDEITAEADYARQERRCKLTIFFSSNSGCDQGWKDKQVLKSAMWLIQGTRTSFQSSLTNISCSVDCWHLKGMMCKSSPPYSAHKGLYLINECISKKTQWSCPPELINF